jgi:predicted RNA-binding Zn-ribbon protein involved in translation (DUF1610 family)
MEKQVVLSVKCPHCGKSFMDESHQVNGQSGIKLNIETDHDRGIIWLCAIYGCFTHKTDIELKEEELVNFFCPHCKKSLLRDISCKECNAPVVGMNIVNGGKVNICSRKGCSNHYVIFEDLNDALKLFYDKFDTYL